jgi:lipopolysaccharide transport system ATP-binding protein
MSAPGAAIRVEGLGKRYALGERGSYDTLRDRLAGAFRPARTPARRHDTLWALEGVSFAVAPGEVVGVIGRNGAGKSTLLKILSRITRPTTGRAVIAGRVGSLLEVGTGFHPELTGRENAFLNGAILGMRRAEITAKFDEIVAFAEVARFIDTPVKHYSSGMYLRLAFAVAAHLDTEILLVDEVLAVGDSAFQRKCIGKMSDVARAGRTVLLVSHNMSAILNLCRRALLIEAGRVAFDGAADTAVERYLAAGAGPREGDVPPDHPGRLTGMRPAIRRIRLVGQARTGADLVLEIAYDVGDLRLDYAVVAVNSTLGERICTVATHLTPGFAGVMQGRGVLECRMPRVPLADGEYSLVVALGTRTPPRNVDCVEDALRFRVNGGDYFGTGATLLRAQGPLAQRSEWRVRAEGPAAVAVPGAGTGGGGC